MSLALQVALSSRQLQGKSHQLSRSCDGVNALRLGLRQSCGWDPENELYQPSRVARLPYTNLSDTFLL